MPNERDFNDNRIQANIAEDRDLDHQVGCMIDFPTLEALDTVIIEEGWIYRAPFIRSLIVSALRQRGKLPE